MARNQYELREEFTFDSGIVVPKGTIVLAETDHPLTDPQWGTVYNCYWGDGPSTGSLPAKLLRKL